MRKRIVLLLGCFAVLTGVVMMEYAPDVSVIVTDDAKCYALAAIDIAAQEAVIGEQAIALERDIGPAGSENCDKYNDAGLLAFESFEPGGFRKEDPGNSGRVREKAGNEKHFANQIHGPPIVQA